MDTTITVRADEGLRKALETRAAATGKSLSGLIREILEDAVANRTVEGRAGHLKGTLRLPRRPADPWRRRLRERNWRE